MSVTADLPDLAVLIEMYGWRWPALTTATTARLSTTGSIKPQGKCCFAR